MVDAAGSPDAGPDAASDEIPRFSSALYLDADQIDRISRFRSGVGHDFADSYESCRSMKHYLCPTGSRTGSSSTSATRFQRPVRRAMRTACWCAI